MIPNRTLSLHDYWNGVPAGEYTITVEQSVSGTVDAHSFGKSFSDTRTLQVRGPRFALTSELVYATYPVPGSTGQYGNDLPHLVLSRAVLPWERILDASEPTVPWLALLLLDENELPVDAASGRGDQTRPVSELLPGSSHVQPAKTLVPELAAEKDPAGPATCRTIDIPVGVFTDVMPRFTELRDLCHVRRVAGAGGGDYAVVLSNRLPRGDARYTAHLVSLEGFGKDQLSGRVPLSLPDQSQAEKVRMVSLWSWSFTSSARAKPSFLAVAKNLADRSKGKLPLRLPDTSTGDGSVAKRLWNGYVPVGHQLPTGERSFAWYRGPFTPVVPQALPAGEKALASEAAALIYSVGHGVFDVSYASAFALGKTIALANTDLAKSLGELRQQGMRAAQEFAKRLGQGLSMDTGVGERHRTKRQIDAVPADPLAGVGTITRSAFERLAGATNLLAEGPETPGEHPARSRPIGAVGAAPAEGTDPLAPLLSSSAGGADGSPALRAVRHTVARHAQRIAKAGLDPDKLLTAVPFDHLVPNADLLPPESVRFFHVDPEWVKALTAGASSLGLSTTLDIQLHTELNQRVLATTALPAAGMLLRSTLYRDWPDLLVLARRNTSGGSEDVLFGAPRPLAPDLALVFFSQPPDTVVIRQPPQVLHFGLDGADFIQLRHPRQPGGGEVGSSMDRRLTGIGGLLRARQGAGGREVLDVEALATALRDKLAESPPEWESSQPLPPAVLGLQLLNTPGQLVLGTALKDGAES
ncbi:hypothetical protein [Streptantibioticus ferralitis]|uniref:Uncharacterized protein n=1 Tax=Streptantibioticus ferralitis TaxID=236510 RepID=A0ABT5Z0R3_9ACTN|nr:hypothetical protein [Streptantibioticus ferralitis]MDF2257422.1 hypothetical protein [Streptantibioticus ferralitis]